MDPGTYILSAVVSEAEHAAELRGIMRGLLVGKSHKKLHWRSEDAARKELIAKTIASLQLEHLVVVRSDAHTAKKPERQRRLCMERMLPELVSMGVDNAVIESRGKKDDRRDEQTLHYLRRKRQLGGHLHINHVGGPADPMLWIPDACCGAVTQMRCGNPHYFEYIESRVTLIDL
ncbi:hypothetical protein BST29_03330 [Mycobacterium malmoense]|uniref:Uncharacterized protein n=2 Tax=Mycobacterium malmoense TaxID=1780 RepID=A0ABX3SYB1_MYCMA|nr:hypothetical protein BST29_03330 [Mycobacterium malmoense]